MTYNLCIVDTETGGLDPATNPLIELAYQVTNPSGVNVLSEVAHRIIPTSPVEARAAKVNGYTPEKWADAVPIEAAIHEFAAATVECIYVGHRVDFDMGFLDVATRRVGVPWPGRKRRVDTQYMSWPLAQQGLIVDQRLETIAAHYGIDPGEVHTALADVRTCREVYLRLMETWRLGLAAPELCNAFPVGRYTKAVLVDPRGRRHAESGAVPERGWTWCGERPGDGWTMVVPLGESRGLPLPDCQACWIAARAARLPTGLAAASVA